MEDKATYSLLDFGLEKRFERWGEFTLSRPDPTATGRPVMPRWNTDASYKGEKGKGRWQTRTPLPQNWPVQFDNLRLHVKLAPFKHTGVFPEQMQNWAWARDRAARLAQQGGDRVSILNLFAYTGGATIALAKDTCYVTHVDASKPAIAWARENAQLNAIPTDGIRWMLEDASLFVSRELRRGRKYDAILLDPPAFGHGPDGKAWRIERDLPPLLANCCRLLSARAGFLILNSYAREETPRSISRLAGDALRQVGRGDFEVEAKELFLTAVDGRKLSTGVVARCSR